MSSRRLPVAWNDPRVQGALQVTTGFFEASAGAALAPTPLAPLGVAMLIHGADRAATGMYTAMAGQPMTTLTSQLLQKTGMSPERADRLDENASFFGPLGARALAYKFLKLSSQSLAFAQRSAATFAKKGSATLNQLARPVGERLTKPGIELSRFHQAARNLSETGQNNIRILRGWAKSKGWEKMSNLHGGPEKWGIFDQSIQAYSWRLRIKPEGSFRPGLQAGSNIPRFDARLYPSKFKSLSREPQ